MAGRFLLLTDEHIPTALVQALRQEGWDVMRVVDVGELGQGSEDGQIFEWAARNGRVILSSDEKALWRPKKLREEDRPFAGMLCWPQRHHRRMSVGDAVRSIEALAEEDGSRLVAEALLTGRLVRGRHPRRATPLRAHADRPARSRAGGYLPLATERGARTKP